MEGRRRVTLLEHLSGIDGGRQTLEGLITLDCVLGTKKTELPPEAPPQQPPTAPLAEPVTHLLCNRTLSEILKDDDSAKKERNPWKALKDRLWLNRVVANSSSHRYLTSSVNSVSELTHNMTQDDSPSAGDKTEENSASNSLKASRVGSSRFAATRSESNRYGDSFEPDASAVWDLRAMSRHNSSRQLPTSEPQKREKRITFRGVDPETEEENDEQPDSARVSRSSVAEERTLSAREAVAAQEAAEAAAAAAAEAEESKEMRGGEMKMSLMDLLEEEGSSYMMGDDDENYEEEDEDAETKEQEEGTVEYNCCICMVRHKGAAFIPCGHAFCRLCSRELYVSRGNCPICNNFIAEILDIF